MRLRDVRWVSGIALLLGAAAVGCMPSPKELDTGPLESSFAVSDYFTPTGFIGDGLTPGSLGAQVDQGCKPRPTGARGHCYVFTYRMPLASTNPFAGLFWLFPTDNWGSNPGRAVDTTKFQQIRFFAAVEAPTPTQLNGNDLILTTHAGGIDPSGLNDPNRTHADAFTLDAGARVGADVGPTLKAFHMPITDFARTAFCDNPNALCVNGAAGAVIGAFAWGLTYPLDADPTGATPVKLYLDDIVWDTEPAPPM
jgi:hypothetical protein